MTVFPTNLAVWVCDQVLTIGSRASACWRNFLPNIQEMPRQKLIIILINHVCLWNIEPLWPFRDEEKRHCWMYTSRWKMSEPLMTLLSKWVTQPQCNHIHYMKYKTLQQKSFIVGILWCSAKNSLHDIEDWKMEIWILPGSFYVDMKEWRESRWDQYM